MPSNRTIAANLARFLDGLSTPAYFLDSELAIVYCNEACLSAFGQTINAVVGQVCTYGGNEPAHGAPGMAQALCPPPDVLADRHQPVRAALPWPAGSGSTARATFHVLSDESGALLGVLAIVDSAAQPDQEPAEKDNAEALHTLIHRYRREAKSYYQVDQLVGESALAKRIRAQVRLAAKDTSCVVIAGPRGSGREHVAKAIHYASSGEDAALVPLACGLLTAELLQSTIRAIARPRLANPKARPGSLLLLDVEQMPVEGQVELAGLLSVGELPLRVIATSRAPFPAVAERSRLRAELTTLLSTLLIELPPLRSRLEDLALLAQWAIEKCNARAQKQIAGISGEALDRLNDYSWPGNLAELIGTVEQAHARAAGPWIGPQDFSPEMQHALSAARHPIVPEETIDLEQFLARIERELIERAMSQAKGNKTKAARLLGMNRPRLYRRLVQLGFEETPDFVEEEEAVTEAEDAGEADEDLFE